MALTAAVKEATWLRLLLTELGVLDQSEQFARILIKTDNQAAKALAENPVQHDRTKHIDIQFHYVRDEINSGRIDLVHVASIDMAADGLTKLLTGPQFYAFLKHLRMVQKLD